MSSIFTFLASKGISKRMAIAGGIGLKLAILTKLSFHQIPAGRIGYKNLFGNVYEKRYEPGYTFMNPLADMVVMDLRKKILNYESQVSSNEGLEIKVEVNIVYRLDHELAQDTYKTTGYNYENIMITPQVNACVRDAISGYNAKDLYNDKTRVEIRDKIHNELLRTMSKNVIVDDVLINKIVLPSNLTKAIEEKLKAEQEMQKMEFTLEKEKKEAERKEIEARGIKAFQDMVSGEISDKILQWKAIDATEKLALSSNSKLVFIGNGKDGLPVLMSA
jgi:regulator of protease activity HflC (stomatin/prohibitin superfamily)